MATQSYANHVHRPIPTALALFFLIISTVGFVRYGLGRGGWSFGVGVAGLLAAVMVLIAISRLYITKLQNRIIKVEMRVRGAGVLTSDQQRSLHALDLPRLVAIRFASDEELPGLLERAVREGMTPKDIKRAIKNWVPDLDRT